MRKGVAGLCSLCMVGSLLAWIPAPRANARVGVVDKQLLGVRLLQSYKQVLQLYGQPTRIYRNNETVNFIPATDANGRETGGVKGLGDSADSGGAGAGGGKGGMPGSMGMPGTGGFPGGGAVPGRSSGPQGGVGGPGSGGAPGSFGGGSSPDGGGALGGATTANDKPETFAESGGFIWVYFYPGTELAYEFIFNNDNRCIAIWQRGRYKGQPSERGIRLGDAASKVYSTYGWPDSVEQQSTNMALNYNVRHHAQISLLNGKVIGIAVFLREGQLFRVVTSGSGGAGGPGAAPGGFPGSGGGRRGGGAKGFGGAD